MLTIEQIGEYFRVAGYPDGSDWWVPLPHARPKFVYGVAGPEHVWYGDWNGDRDARLYILHAPSRRRSASVQLEGLPSSAVRSVRVTASRDGRRIYVLQSLGPGDATEGRVHVVDVPAGAVVAVHGGFPAPGGVPPVERPDGRLLLATLRQSLVLLDPTTGDWEESGTQGDPGGPDFLSGSPDGRYWIRFDPTSLPVHESTPGLLDRLFGDKKANQVERRYGVTVQVWEAFPLRFVRRVVVAWLTVEELPDETYLAHSDPRARPSGLRSRRAMWDAVTTAMAATNAAPSGALPPRSAYPPAVADDEAAWVIVEKNLKALAGGSRCQVVGWQPDGAAFWVDSNKFLSCVGVDGTISPRLYTERLGLARGARQPVAAGWREVVPLPGRKARVAYDKGEALFDGAPSATPQAPRAIPAARDRWQPATDDRVTRDRKAADQRLEVLREERRRIVIPLAGWTEAGCVAAIDALTREVNEDFSRPAVNREIRIVFASGDGEVSEERFFTEAGARFPGVAPAIRRLIDRYCDVAERNDYLFSRGEEGIGIFASAVKTLGVLDRSALPTLRRYGIFVDVEHEYYFAGTTVPAVVKAHGWTDDVVDFVFWVLAWDYYNTLDDYGQVWGAWGLRDAVVHREPRAFARHVAADLAETIRMKDDPGRYGIGGLDKLARQIPQPHEPWAAAFFGELARVFAEPADPGTSRRAIRS